MSEGSRVRGRRLGAIVFTDVVGYSSIASQDEKRALRLLDEHRSVLGSVFPRYEGRVVKTIGDAFLVEFASAVEAVNCAMEIQKEMRRFNSGRGPSDAIQVRIGIHVGDIVHSNGDVLGDAVNVAARVQPLAEPGGVCVTRQVVDQIERKVEYEAVKVGMRELKNIPMPVELYRMVLPSEMPSTSEKPTLDPLRVAILPFSNMSADPNDRYFADGMTEELISTVSKIGGLSVISRTSVMRYKDTTLPVGQIGDELSVGSVLEGSVRKAGNRVRITAQLIEVESDRHLWAQSYDRDLTDIFAVQGDIAQQVAEALKVRLLSDEKQVIGKKATGNPEAYTLYLKGRYFWNERTKEGVTNALKFFEESVKADPRFALAYSGIADCYLILADYGWMSNKEAGPLAREYAEKALEIDSTLAEAHASLGCALNGHYWDFVSGERELKRAIELRPNYAIAYHWYVLMLDSLGRFEEAYEMEKRASELDPYSRVVSAGLGINLMFLGRVEEAIQQLDRVTGLHPDFVGAHLWKSVALAEVGKFDLAIREAEKTIELDNASASNEANLAFILAVSGRKEEGRRILDGILSRRETGHVSPATVAMVLCALGDGDEGFKWLEKAYEDHDSSILYFEALPWLHEYKSDPRWLEINRKIGLAKGK